MIEPWLECASNDSRDQEMGLSKGDEEIDEVQHRSGQPEALALYLSRS